MASWHCITALSIALTILIAAAPCTAASLSHPVTSAPQDFDDVLTAYLKASAAPKGLYQVISTLWADSSNDTPLDWSDFYAFADKMNRRADCSDFEGTFAIRFLSEFSHDPRVPSNVTDAVSHALLNWQYWMDEANVAGGFFQGTQMFWTENHQFSFHSSEYLAGWYFGDAAVFPGSNMTGAQHRAKGRKFVLDWLERRYRWGFSEFHSDTYYEFDILNLANLVRLAPDADIVTRASMVLDLLLFDVATHSHAGMVASARGRSYGNNKFNVTKESLATTAALLTGTGYISHGNGAAVCLALSHLNPNVTYTVPNVILTVGYSRPQWEEQRERVGISPDDKTLAKASDLGYSSPDDGLVWWGNMDYAHPRTVDLAFTMGDDWNLYHSNQSIFAALGKVRFLRDIPGFIPAVAEVFKPLSEGSQLGPAELYTYRRRDVALGAAMDYDAGRVGFQQHAWQATLSGTALVFTTAPGPNLNVGATRPLASEFANDIIVAATSAETTAASNEETTATSNEEPIPGWAALIAIASAADIGLDKLREILTDFIDIRLTLDALARQEAVTMGLWDGNSDDYADGYWTGSSSMPCIGQWRNGLIALYRSPYNGAIKSVFPHETHAYFPIHEFDAVVDQLNTTGWAFGQRDNGYVAIFTNSDDASFTTSGNWTDVEIVARGGTEYVWACFVGSADVDGSFRDFVSMYSHADVNATSIHDVTIAVDNGTTYAFGWEKELVVTTHDAPPMPVPLGGYARFDTAYTRGDFPSTSIRIAAGYDALELDYDANTRDVLNNITRGNDPLAVADVVADIACRAAHRAVAEWANAPPLGLGEFAHFSTWGYEGGVIQTGAWEASAITPQCEDLRDTLSAKLDVYTKSPHSIGGKLLRGHTEGLPWGYAVGDKVGLYPIAYAARHLVNKNISLVDSNLSSNGHDSNTDGTYSDDSDVGLVVTAANAIITDWPHRLDDGTASRILDWIDDGMVSVKGKAVWADDAFMGTAAVVRAGALTKNVTLLRWAAEQTVLVHDHLFDASTGLLRHGADAGKDRHSCCVWGRANGWVAVALGEAAVALSALVDKDDSTLTKVRTTLAQHISAALQFQRSDGAWTNIVNAPAAFAETSVTAMFAQGMILAETCGALPRDEIVSPLISAMDAVQRAVHMDGTVVGVQGETPIHDTAAQYGETAADYGHSAPGLGSVLRSLAAYARWLRSLPIL